MPHLGYIVKPGQDPLIIMSLLHSARGEASISCHRVRVHGVILQSTTNSQDRLIHNLFVWFNAHTLLHLNVSRWFCYYHRGYRSGIDDRQWDRRALSEHMLTRKHSGPLSHTRPRTKTHTCSPDETLPGPSIHAGVTNENRQRVCLLYYV